MQPHTAVSSTQRHTHTQQAALLYTLCRQRASNPLWRVSVAVHTCYILFQSTPSRYMHGSYILESPNPNPSQKRLDSTLLGLDISAPPVVTHVQYDRQPCTTYSCCCTGTGTRTHLSGGDVVVPRQPNPEESLVVAEVQVGLAPVVEHKDLSVLERRHRARVRVLLGKARAPDHPPTHPPVWWIEKGLMISERVGIFFTASYQLLLSVYSIQYVLRYYIRGVIHTYVTEMSISSSVTAQRRNELLHHTWYF